MLLAVMMLSVVVLRHIPIPLQPSVRVSRPLSITKQFSTVLPWVLSSRMPILSLFEVSQPVTQLSEPLRMDTPVEE